MGKCQQGMAHIDREARAGCMGASDLTMRSPARRPAHLKHIRNLSHTTFIRTPPTCVLMHASCMSYSARLISLGVFMGLSHSPPHSRNTGTWLRDMAQAVRSACG